MKFIYQRLPLKDYRIKFMIMYVLSIGIIIITSLIYCHRIYNEKKENLKVLLSLEARNLQNTLVINMDYSKFFLKFLLLSKNYNDIDDKSTKKILDSYTSFIKLQWKDSIFSWNNYQIIDNDFKRINKKDKATGNLDGLGSRVFQFNAIELDSIIQNNDNLGFIYNIFSDYNIQHKAAIIFYYQTNEIIKKLKKIINSKYINFIITDNNGNVVIQSKPSIKHLVDKNGLNNRLIKRLYQQETQDDVFRFSFIKRENYFIKRTKNFPFNIIVSVDTRNINSYIIRELSKKFLEVIIFGATCLLSMMYVYKRELLLRNKAERATIIATKATKAKSDFLAFTAHEIRSPLGFIVTGSELMSNELFGPLPANYKSYADGIYNNSKIILEFIKDILDENKIIEGKFKIINSVVDVTKIIKECVLINQTRFNNRLVNIQVNIEKNIPHLISDKRRIAQIINNLISNAIKYSKDESVVSVSCGVTDEGIAISIRDEGIGMNQEQVNMLLVDDTVKANEDYESYGLGFLIVKMLVEAHDGKLMVTSSAGIGTNITIIFPKYKLIYTYDQGEETSL